MRAKYQRRAEPPILPPGTPLAARVLEHRGPGGRHAHADEGLAQPHDEGSTRASGSAHLIEQQVQQPHKCMCCRHYASTAP
jgi:hypothetical protein